MSVSPKTKKIISPRKRPQKRFDPGIQYANLGLQLFLIIGLSVWGGIELDQYLNLNFPVFTISFLMLSLFGSLYKLYTQITK
ncbi:MAG: AtpZ/AtpI family protein [Bacteroidota bacterium]